MAIATINPATGKIIKTFDPLTDPQIDEKIGKAEETFRSYRWSSFADRGKLMSHAARILEEEQVRFGRLMTLAQATCACCGAHDVIGAAAAYMHGMGTIIRCNRCDAAFIRVAHIRGHYLLDMRGVRLLQMKER